MKHTFKLFVPVLLSVFVFVSAILYTVIAGSATLRAQVEDAEPEATEDVATEGPGEIMDATVVPDSLDEKSVIAGKIASCSEYFPSNLVTLTASTNFISYPAGDPVMIRGQVRNDSTLDLSNVDVVARVVRVGSEGDLAGSGITVDEMNVAEGLAIGAGEEYELSGNYLLPLNLSAGSYEIRLYAYSFGRFDLAGSAADDVPAAVLVFDVEGGDTGSLYLNQNGITVNDTAADQAAIPVGSKISVFVPLENTTGTDRTAALTYVLYSAQGGEANIIETKKQNVRVPAGGTTVTYDLPAAKLPSYVLRITSEVTDPAKNPSVYLEKSIATVRLGVSGGLDARLAFVGLSPSGFAGSNGVRLVTCFGAQSENDTYNKGRVETVLFDDQGTEIGRLEYAGSIPVALSALTESFAADRRSSSYAVESKVYDSNGAVIDQFKNTYGCADLGEGYCEQGRKYANLIFGLAALLIILGAGYYTFVRKDSSINNLRV